MLPYFSERFGNAASRTHVFGWTAQAAVEQARETIAGMIGAQAGEIVFTSGATESDNLAIKGVAEANAAKGRHIVTTAIEHHAVLDSCRHLERAGFRVSYVGVGSDGIVDPEAVRDVLTDETILVSVMLANNEVGTLQPIAEIGRLTRERGVLLHCDAVQGLGRTAFDVNAMNVDLASLTAHKIYGPKGCGALYVRTSKPRVRLVAQVDGGGHERARRSGTLNVPGIVGFAKACEILQAEGEEENQRLRLLRDELERRIVDDLDGVIVNGHREQRLPGSLNVSFEGIAADALMMALKHVAISSGSACTSASLEPSYVLRAMGRDPDLARGSLRFGLGRFNTRTEVDYVAEQVVSQAEQLRAALPA
jgi:cysteine desulfurase